MSGSIGYTFASFIRERLVAVDSDGTVTVLQRHKRGRSRAPERIEHQRVSVACRDNNPSHKLGRKSRRVIAYVSGMTNLPHRRRIVTKWVEQHARICPRRIVADRAGLWFGSGSMGTD